MTDLKDRKAVSLPFQSSDFLSGSHCSEVGALPSLLDALGSNDASLVAKGANSDGGSQIVLSQVSSLLYVLADYVYCRADSPSSQLYADDNDLALSINTVAELVDVARSAIPKEIKALDLVKQNEKQGGDKNE